ncbi:MAG: PEP-CTERM sorting domain-containing protein [Planctomycetota bacterium]
MRKFLLAAAAALVLAQPAVADFDLQVTEIWPGNNPGNDDVTDDWFELTNVGTMAWTSADGDLYFDDDSENPVVADLMSGITSIAPGESVIFVDEGPVGAAVWSGVWGAVVSPLPQVGSYSGAGLSGGGDAVSIFLDANFDGPDAGELIEVAGYPDADLSGGQSYDVVLGAFSTVGDAAGSVATIAVNDVQQPAIGSPGTSVPEPASAALFALGVICVMTHRRK